MNPCRAIFSIICVSWLLIDCATPPLHTNTRQKTVVYLQIDGLPSRLKKENYVEGVARIESELTVSAVGDIIPHNNIKRVAGMHRIVTGRECINNGGYDYLFEMVRDLLRSDITIANYESPVAPRTGLKGEPFIFNSDLDLVRAVKKANINVFNIANNHIYDQKLDGFVESLENFSKEKVDIIGIYRSDVPQPLVIDKNNVKVSIFGFTTLLNNLPKYKEDGLFVRRLDLTKDIHAIKNAKSVSDVVIVYIHWGEEYRKEPSDSQREIAEALAEAGADIIIGGHPHVLQPLALIPTKDGRVVPVAFSLGNFISNQSRNYHYPVSSVDEGRTRDSVIMKFSLKKFVYEGGSFVVVADLRFVPLWTYNNNLYFSKGFKESLEIYPFPIVERLMGLKGLIEEAKDNKEKINLIMEYENLNLRLKTIRDTVGEDYVR